MDGAHRLGQSVAMRRIVLFLALAVLPPAVHAQEAGGSGVRIIAPDLVSPPQIVNPSRLERIAPRAPLSDPAPERPEAEGGERLFKPRAVAAGRFVSAGRKVRLDAIRVIPADRLCDTGDGGTWPCGVHARTAFRMWLRGRALECRFDEDDATVAPPNGEETARCRLGRQDAGAWLVEQGWALAEEGGPYTVLEESARRARRGVFGGGPARYRSANRD